MYAKIIEKLEAGVHVELRPKGQSMTPLIQSGQRILIAPYSSKGVFNVGSVVLAKVHGKYFIHLVTAIEGKRVQISNNHGHINGWTTLDKVYGVVTEIG